MLRDWALGPGGVDSPYLLVPGSHFASVAFATSSARSTPVEGSTPDTDENLGLAVSDWTRQDAPR
jgi:hypothetical protein